LILALRRLFEASFFLIRVFPVLLPFD